MKCDFEVNKTRISTTSTSVSVFTFHTWFHFIFFPFSNRSFNENYANFHFLIDMNWIWLQDHSSVNKLLHNLIRWNVNALSAFTTSIKISKIYVFFLFFSIQAKILKKTFPIAFEFKVQVVSSSLTDEELILCKTYV